MLSWTVGNIKSKRSFTEARFNRVNDQLENSCIDIESIERDMVHIAVCQLVGSVTHE